MKTLRYLLITFAIMVNMHIANATAQSLATEPQIGFQSTSSMAGSGSTLPQAAVDGAYTTYDAGSASPAHQSGIRKGSWNPGDEPGPDDNDEPYQDPIGEGAWALLVAAAVYGVWCMVYRRRKRVTELKS